MISIKKNIYTGLTRQEKIKELHKLENDVRETTQELEEFNKTLTRPMTTEEKNKVKEIWNKIKIAKRNIKTTRKALGIK